MITAEGQHFICPLSIGYMLYQRVILAFRCLFLAEKRVLQDLICCPFAVNKCPFKRTYFSIISKECLVFGNIICCPFRMHCLALFSVPLDPKYTLIVVSLDSVTPTERLLSIRQKDIKSNNKTVRKESLRKGLSSLLIKSVMKGKLNPT